MDARGTHRISRMSGGAGQLVSRLMLRGGEVATTAVSRLKTARYRMLLFCELLGQLDSSSKGAREMNLVPTRNLSHDVAGSTAKISISSFSMGRPGCMHV